MWSQTVRQKKNKNIGIPLPVGEATVSVDEGTDKLVFISRELGMSVLGF